MDLLIYQKINQLLQEQKQGAVATIVDATPGTPRKIGTKFLILPDGSIQGTIGGGKFELQIIEEGVKVCQSGEPILINKDLSHSSKGIGAVCGGQVSIFIEPILTIKKLFIFGGGHVGKAIAQMGQYLDFSLNILDDREEWANKENYPMNCRLWLGDMTQSAKEIPVDKNSFIIILTYSWQTDEAILKELIQKDFAYLGIIGSKTKILTHKKNLKDAGIPPEAFDRIHAPIGLPIGAYSPSEIAVSILAEIIAVMKDKRKELPYLL